MAATESSDCVEAVADESRSVTVAGVDRLRQVLPDEETPKTRLGAAWALGFRTVRDSIEDRLPGLAAEVAFYILLSLPPLLLVGLGAVGYTGELFGPETVEEVRLRILSAAATVLTPTTMQDIVRPAVDSLLEQGRADILSIGAILALWSGSRALRVIVRAVTIAYDLKDRRTWWQHRLPIRGWCEIPQLSWMHPGQTR